MSSTTRIQDSGTAQDSRQRINKQRHHFPNKGLSSQCYGFSSSHVQMWELDHKEGWAFKRSDAFKLWCWRRLLRVPWTSRRSNQSFLKESNPEHSLEGLMLKMKLQYFGHLMRRSDSLEKTLMLGKIESRRRRGPQRIRWLDSITDSMDMNLSTLGDSGGHRSLVCCSPWGHKESARLSNWTTTTRIETQVAWLQGSHCRNHFITPQSALCKIHISHQQMGGSTKCGLSIQWDIILP